MKQGRLGFPALILILILVAASFGGIRDATAQATAPQESRKIEYLINEVEALPGAVFIRNGVGHDGAAAAAHLRLKWHAAGSRVKTADDFIRLCATGSSVSGLPYYIRIADGHEMTSAQFLRQKLREFEASAPNP